MKFGEIVLFASALLLPTLSQAATTYYLDTPQTGAQVSLTSTNYVDWTSPTVGTPAITGIMFASETLGPLDPTFQWMLGGGNFDIKDGSGTIGSITLSLFDVMGQTQSLVTSVNWTMSDVCAFKVSTTGNCQNFDANNPVPIYFTDNGLASGNATPVTLTTGEHYLVVLSSDALSGNTQYYIKNPTAVTIEDPNGVSLMDPTPEPSSAVLIGSGLLFAIAGTFRRKIFAR